ncbi:MAG: hypothetical protein NC548_20115 [Lachnospiraceae bacterium]|nr:hypothetical protein [Lachnospiraceae bacterium]
MAHKYDKYMDGYVEAVQKEKERLAKLPDAKHMEITLDSDATEQEVNQFLHGYQKD